MHTYIPLLALSLVTHVARADNEQDKCWTSVHKAAAAGDEKRMAKILAKDRFRADVEDKCGSAVRPLMLAAHGGHIGVVKLLLDAGASADIAHGGNGVTPLMAAAAGGDAKMVKLLLGAHASINRAEARNWTALSFASQQGTEEVVRALLEAGADPAWVTGAGCTPYMLAKDVATSAGSDTVEETAQRDSALAKLALLEKADSASASDSTLWLHG